MLFGIGATLKIGNYCQRFTLFCQYPYSRRPSASNIQLFLQVQMTKPEYYREKGRI